MKCQVKSDLAFSSFKKEEEELLVAAVVINPNRQKKKIEETDPKIIYMKVFRSNNTGNYVQDCVNVPEHEKSGTFPKSL